MIVVAGALHVAADARAAFLEGCRAVVEQARAAQGCLDFALSPDLVDPRRVNVLERWETADDLARFRGSGPSDAQNAAIESADVREYEVTTAQTPTT